MRAFWAKVVARKSLFGGCGGLAAGGEKGEATALAGLGSNGLSIGE